jgi:cyclohexanecarboxylate-CoA ligase
VQLPNWTEFPVIAAALSRIGAILVPIMPIYREDEVAYVLRHSGAVAAVTCHEFRGFGHLEMFQKVRHEAPDLHTVYVARPSAGADASETPALDSLMAGGDLAALEEEAGPDSPPDDGFLIVYTSGTTSRPKGCLHTFNTYRASANAIIKGLAYTEQDVQFGPSPISHTTGLVTSVIMPLIAGAKSYLMEAWNPEEGLRTTLPNTTRAACACGSARGRRSRGPSSSAPVRFSPVATLLASTAARRTCSPPCARWTTRPTGQSRQMARPSKVPR